LPIAALEVQHHAGPPRFELWVDEGGGILKTRDGKSMTRDAFDAAFPNAIKIKLAIFENSSRDGGGEGSE
jgi:hypothetical protein